jgi:poly [ADP-ribose] polymerase 7/11/12/13
LKIVLIEVLLVLMVILLFIFFFLFQIFFFLGTSYGVGVYFSSDPLYSNQFAKPNHNGERSMFLARVLVGKTTLGNPSMKTKPPGYDTTTDGNHIFVTYHDAQAYAEYLITYK